MNEQFKNLVVKIESEEMLHQAREIIERNGQKVGEDFWFLTWDESQDFLCWVDLFDCWGVNSKSPTDTIITFQEFEQLFKTGNNE